MLVRKIFASSYLISRSFVPPIITVKLRKYIVAGIPLRSKEYRKVNVDNTKS